VPTPVYLHIGARKSGTTSLQRSLRLSADELAAQGVNLLYATREEQVRHQVVPIRAFLASGDDTAARQSLRELAERIRDRPEMTHLLSLETLAELPRPATDLIIGELAEFEVHVVVTARHWVLTLPSEWQQAIKSRLTISYPDFLAAVRDRTPDAAEFLSMQDMPAIVDRWGALLPLEQVHVIACPPRSRTEGTLLDLFCGLVGIAPASLKVPSGDLNTSISLDQAELVRRINAELGDRLTRPGVDYDAGVRGWIVRGSMQPRATESIRIPQEFAEWAVAAARQQYDDLLATGVDIVGRPEDLLPDGDPTTGPLQVGEDAVAAAAVATLADLAQQHYDEVRASRRRIDKLTTERDRLRRKVQTLQKNRTPAAGSDRPARQGLRSRLGRIARRRQEDGSWH
jgi:hypothetical protein